MATDIIARGMAANAQAGGGVTEGTITNALGYKPVSETDVNNAINNSSHLKRVITTTLPDVSKADKNTIYMIKVTSAKGNDKYQEYMLIDGSLQMIGDTSTDLTDYAKISDVNNELDNKVDKVAGKGLSTNDYTTADKSQVAQNKTDILSLQNGKVDKVSGKGLSTNDLTNDLKASYNNAVKKSHTHNNSETLSKLTEDKAGNLIFAGSTIYKSYHLYGFRINQAESNPSSMVTYLADSKDFTPVGMNYDTGIFSYGSWGNAWFIKYLKPCVLGFDGIVKNYLNPDNYAETVEGDSIDITDENLDGNVMIEVPKVYYKCVNIDDDTAEYYFSDRKLDNNFKCWSHTDNNGNEIPYCYVPAYNGWKDSTGRLRSLSGKTPTASLTSTAEITAAKLNNTTDDVIWYTELFCDRKLFELLGILLAKSTDSQTVFGRGNDNSGQSGVLNTGTMDDKGLFWGTNDGTSGVKFFGMENFWGNLWRRIGGWINDNGTQKIKMTYGTSDGSTVTGYNTNGSGYITVENSTPTGTSSGYINKMIFTESGFVPTIASGSSSTYYCDGLWFNNNQVNYALVGGYPFVGVHCGLFCSRLNLPVGTAGWDLAAAISCKPLGTKG